MTRRSLKMITQRCCWPRPLRMRRSRSGWCFGNRACNMLMSAERGPVGDSGHSTTARLEALLIAGTLSGTHGMLSCLGNEPPNVGISRKRADWSAKFYNAARAKRWISIRRDQALCEQKAGRHPQSFRSPFDPSVKRRRRHEIRGDADGSEDTFPIAPRTRCPGRSTCRRAQESSRHGKRSQDCNGEVRLESPSQACFPRACQIAVRSIL